MTSFMKKLFQWNVGKYEKCVSCNDITNVPRDLNVTARRFYIEGAGQLCGRCWTLVYPEKNSEVWYDANEN